MFPAPIEEYVRPRTISEALDAISKSPDREAMFLAGGQSLMQAIKSRMVRPDCIVDLQSIAELVGIRCGNELSIGAMTRYADIARSSDIPTAYLALRDAAARVGDRQVRNCGTIGGSVCWNYVASCMPAVVLATGGTMNLVAPDGSERSVAAHEFFFGPFDTAREDNEILVSISWPTAVARTGSAYKKWGLVTDSLPVVGMCVHLSLGDDGRCSGATVSVAGLSDGAQLAPTGAEALVGSSGDHASIDAAMDAVANSVTTHSDHWAGADYRQNLIRTVGRDVCALAFSRAREE